MLNHNLNIGVGVLIRKAHVVWKSRDSCSCIWFSGRIGTLKTAGEKPFQCRPNFFRKFTLERASSHRNFETNVLLTTINVFHWLLSKGLA